MARLESDALEMLLAAADGRLDDIDLKWSANTALTVVMAAKGYPGSYAKGGVIGGIEAAEKLKGVTVFHAGTKTGSNGEFLADGGRVLGVTALAKGAKAAQKRAYEAVDRIDWADGFCRRDIGWRAIGR